MLQKVMARIDSIFAEASAAATSSTSSSKGVVSVGSASHFPRKAFAYCVRALLVLDKGEVLETAMKDLVATPLAKAYLTQGRVDGTGGRGSYSGLKEALGFIANSIQAALQPGFEVCEEQLAWYVSTNKSPSQSATTRGGLSLVAVQAQTQTLSTSTSPSSQQAHQLDIIINGLWVPISVSLVDRFPGMFAVGIANTLARCYHAVEAFADSLCIIAGPDHAPGVRRRFRKHASVKEFQGRWRTELYFQLRMQEVASRVDRVCDITKASGLISESAEAIYTPLNTNTSTSLTGPSSNLPSTTSSASSADPDEVDSIETTLGDPKASTSKPSPTPTRAVAVTLTLTPTQHTQLQAALALAAFRLPGVRALLTECATCVHEGVLLKLCAGKFFALALRTLLRIEAHIAQVAEVVTPSFPKGCLLPNAQDVGANTATAGGAKDLATPIKARSAPMSLAAPSPAGPLVTAPPPGGLSMDELVHVAADVFHLESWLVVTFAAYVSKNVGGGVKGASEGDGSSGRLESVRVCLEAQRAKAQGTRRAVFARVCSLLGQDCKKALGGVRGVAAKYRMTNKPPPDAASPYVETVLQPFRSFLSRHGSTIEPFAPRGSWDMDVLDDITSFFLSQVQALMETVRSMDSALQRRSKLRATPGGGAGSGAAVGGAGGGALTDSDKISLQLLLDVRAFAVELATLSVDPASIRSFGALQQEVSEATKLIATESNNNGVST